MDLQNIKAIWYDANVHSLENTHISNVIRSYCSLQVFSEMNDTISYLDDNPQKDFVVITSGRNGENLCDKIHSKPNVTNIIVFCLNVNYHQSWASNYPKIFGVYFDLSLAINNFRAYVKSKSKNLEAQAEIEKFNPNMNMDLDSD